MENTVNQIMNHAKEADQVDQIEKCIDKLVILYNRDQVPPKNFIDNVRELHDLKNKLIGGNQNV